MAVTKEIWIKTGYEVFALGGENELKIEKLAKRIGISKSSFYHHFSDLELFIEQLLADHLKQSKIIAQKESKIKTINPELITILIEHKIDLLFNRQLRFNQQKALYKDTLHQSNVIIGNEFIRLWTVDLNLTLTKTQLEGLFELALENFFLQINLENMNFDWLNSYFINLKRIALNFV